jgi:hypothetical protein
VAEFLGRDVEQQVFPAWIVFGETLGEVSHRSGELAIRPAELPRMKEASTGFGSATRTVY